MPSLDGKQESSASAQEKRCFFANLTYGEGLSENLRESLRPRRHNGAKSDLPANFNLHFEGFWSNLRDLFSPSRVSSPSTAESSIPVKEIWSKNKQFRCVQFASVAVHILLLALIVIPTLSNRLAPKLPKLPLGSTLVRVSDFLHKMPPAPTDPSQGGGGGGEHNPMQASKGMPPAFRKMQLTPPRVKTTADAKLLVPPTIVGDPRNTVPAKMPNWGDQNMVLVNESSGPGDRGGIGSKEGLGVGDGSGDGLGPGGEYDTGGGIPCGGCAGTSMPSCLICPRAEYSDEAVKQKYEGIVVLLAVITPDGRAVDIHVSKGLGLGLDEKALEAVRGWRFRPALGPDRKPIATRIPIEVVFHLY
jgi:protein TonB